MSTSTKLETGRFQPPERTRTRTLSLTNASAEFILNSIPLAENTRYVAELDRFVSIDEATRHENALLELWKDADAEKEKLLTAMAVLQEKMRPKGSRPSQGEEETQPYTWKQVITEIQTASDTYKNTTFAKTCERSKVFEHWLTLLPSGDYTSTISGGFLMGVQAARSVSAIQRTIYEALATIPDTLSHASAYVEIYKAHSSDTLMKKTAALCTSIMVVLRLIVEFFAKSSWRRSTSAIMKGGAYQQELTDAILDMKSQALQLREEANLCLQKRIAEMDRKNDLRASREQYRHELAKEELMLAIDSSTEITAQKVCTYLMRQLQSNPDFSVRTGGLVSVANPNFLLNEGDSSPLKMSPLINKGVTVKALLRALDFDRKSHRDDIEYCLTLGFTQSLQFQNRAVWVLRSSELAEFIAGEGDSKLLTVNGNHDGAHFISPLSHVCAKISDFISVSHHIMCLTYFCSRHTDQWQEPRANAVGLISSLTAQLLKQVKKKKFVDFQLDLSSLSNEDVCAVQAEDLDATYHVFQTIIKQLPKGTVVFCLVDGLSAYENSDRRPDTVRLMQKMIKLVKRRKHVTFKCMITFPGRGAFTDLWGLYSAGRSAATLEVLDDL